MPFFRTAFVTEGGSARTGGSSGEDILHFNAVKLSVRGNGNLKLKLLSMDDLVSEDLETINMSARANRQPTVLANMIEQRVCIEGRTYNINDYFRINRLQVYSKFYASEDPR